MIQYKCPFCRIEIETDEALSGKQDTCPECGKVHPVPLSKQDLAKEKAAQKDRKRALREAERERGRVAAEAERIRIQAQWEKSQQRASERNTASEVEQIATSPSRPMVGLVFGILFIVGGIITTAGFMAMDVGSGSGYRGQEIANLDKMNQRLGGTIVGVGLFVAGVILVSLNAIHACLWAATHYLSSRANTTISKETER